MERRLWERRDIGRWERRWSEQPLQSFDAGTVGQNIHSAEEEEV